MSLPLFFVDAFTTTHAFSGNVAAICVLDEPHEDSWLQQVAREMNQPATAFLFPEEDGYRLRWFSALVELDLCGHGTLASSHILWEQGYLTPEESARFSSRGGQLTAQKKGDWIELNFPSKTEEEIEITETLCKGLGVTPLYAGKGSLDYIVELASEEVVRNLQPDFATLATIRTRGIIVTARASSPEYDFVSRFFSPSIGNNEDPVTGSAHCALSPFWSQKLGRTELVGYQASSRGGIVRVNLEDDRVRLSGYARTSFKGRLL